MAAHAQPSKSNQPVSLPNRIAKGWNRSVHIRGKYAYKVQESHYTKRRFGITLRFPAWVRSFKRHGVRNLNLAEKKNYEKYFSRVPQNLRENFARVRKVAQVRGGVFMVMEAVRDYDGSPSRSLLEMQGTLDHRFWKKMDDMLEWMCAQRIPFFDWSPGNFMVKFTSPGVCIPVLIDYKSASTRIYPLQPWLRDAEKRNAVMRKRFAHLKRKYGVGG